MGRKILFQFYLFLNKNSLHENPCLNLNLLLFKDDFYFIGNVGFYGHITKRQSLNLGSKC